jgi:nitrite reductase/ring-hydroxylating ferredoxin subunit
MQKIALLSVCFGFACDGRRLQQQSENDAVRELADLLLAANPTLAASPAQRTRHSSPVAIRAAPSKSVWGDVVRKSEVKTGQAVSGIAFGQEVAVMRVGGKLYGLGGKFPPADSPVAGSKVVGNTVVDGVTGTAFNVATGKVEGKWCPGGIPVVGAVLGALTSPVDLQTVKLQEKGDFVQAQVNGNSVAGYEAGKGYWRGLLDAQGKVDGGYY